MFEFVNGIPPFHAENPQKIFQKILAGKFKFDKHIKLTKNYKNIVKKFLALDPLLRLGSSGSGDVKKQKLFSEVLWEKVLKQEPHFVPTIDKQEDTSYFDPRGILNTEDDESTSESEKDNCTSPLGLSEEVKISFGQFSFKNISVIEKANKDVAKKLQQDSSAKNSPVLTKKEFKIKNAIDLTIQTPASVDLGPNSFELTSPENLNFPDTISMPFKERIQRKSSTGEVPSPEYHNKYANGKEHDLKSYPSSSENSFSLEPVSEARNNTPASPSPCFNGTRQRRSFSFGGPIRSPLREQQTSSTNVSFNIRRKAMIVDSNPLTFQVLEKLLKSYDFQCYYSKNGVGAMSYILNSTFDIIFADVDADSINGCVLANIVRTTENLNSKTPIIGLTSYSIQDNPDIKYLDDFIFKPFNTTSFKPLLDRHLEI
jgi:serine/threonine-protein kinase RIM15